MLSDEFQYRINQGSVYFYETIILDVYLKIINRRRIESNRIITELHNLV